MRSWPCPPSRPRAKLFARVVELRAPVDQFADPLRRLADHVLDHLPIAQRAAGLERVGHVVLEAVVRIEHAGDAALGVVAVRLHDAVLGDDHHRESSDRRPAPPAARPTRCR